MTQTIPPPVATVHDPAPQRTEGREVVAGTCPCGATWTADDSDVTWAEWAFEHDAPPVPEPTYEQQSHAYDVACGLRQLADEIVRHPELARLFEFTQPSTVVDDATEFGRLADMLGAGLDLVRYPGPDPLYVDRRRHFGPVVAAITITAAALAAEPF